MTPTQSPAIPDAAQREGSDGGAACPPGHCRTPSAPCRGTCVQTIQPRDTTDAPVPCGVAEVPNAR
jgi:hypothetical protein